MWVTKNVKVPFGNLDRQFSLHSGNFMKIAEEVFASGKVLQSRKVSEFENKTAEICGRKYGVAVGSCTDALYFALIACGVKPGDEILITSFSFIASLSPILRAGAKPVFVDIEPDYLMMDLRDAEEKITQKTRFLLAVHLFGQCLDMEKTEKFAGRHGLAIIEDAAQSFGSSHNGRAAGGLGAISCVSFDPTKVIGSFGSAGIALTDSEKAAEHIRRLRNHGKSGADGSFAHLGFNSQLCSEHAALLSFKLGFIKKWIRKRNGIAEKYIKGLKGLESEDFTLPRVRENGEHNWHKFVIRTKKRDHLKTFLSENGIETKVHYPYTLSEINYLDEKLRTSCPESKKITEDVLSLPIYPELSEEETIYIIEKIKEFFK